MTTTVNDASVEDFLNGIENETRRDDAFAILKMMQAVTRKKPRMWGSSIVGFDQYHYKYDSGREGDMCMIGFSPRSAATTLYVLPEVLGAAGNIGKYKTGSGCLHIKKLADVDQAALKDLLAESYRRMTAQYK